MYEGAICGALPQPWSSHNSPPSSKNTIDSMVTSSVDLREGSECIVHTGNHNHIDAEDFFIDDLSEFSNEDLAAPIQIDALMDGHSHSLQSSDDYTSASNSKAPSANLKSDCTTANTSTSGSALFHDSPAALVYKCGVSLDIEMDSSLSLPGQDDTGLEWLTSFTDDNLIYGASNFGMDSFLLSNAVEPFDSYDGLMKHGGFEDIGSREPKDLKVGHTVDVAGSDDTQGACHADCFRWDNGTGAKEFDAMMIMLPHSTGSRSARSKRARSAGWSSSNILCSNWDDNSPTNSLNSTSQIMANPAYSSPTFLPKQEEDEQHAGYVMPHLNAELIASSLDAPNRDKPLIGKASKFCSNDQVFHGWAKEEENRKEESVSNYSGLQPRRCTHCLSQKTPQWRAGPQGPKTLCNACGVRYKSGRLFDEYRPAKSPTFLSYKHSNSHKKVMEMRRRKSLQYTNNHHRHNHHRHHHGMHQAHAPAPAALKHAELDPHLGNKLKIKLNPSTLEPHAHYSDVTLISTTRTALDSPSSFLY